MRRLRDLLHNWSLLIPGVLLLLSTQADAQNTSQTSRNAPRSRTPKIHYFESFNASVPEAESSRLVIAGTDTTPRQHLEFAAFGRTQRLELEENTRLMRANGSRPTSMRVLRGVISGKPGSWARLSFVNAQAQGLIWDGEDLYAVEPSAAVADLVAAPLKAPQKGSVIFRLADAEIPLEADFCGAAGEQTMGDNALAAYQTVAAELSAVQAAALEIATPTQALEISALGDAAFRNQYASNAAAQDALLARLNNLDGIFSAQLGIRVQIPSITVYDSNPSQLSTSTSADTLLSSLGSLRAATSSLRDRGLTHLLTGRDLSGSTVGIAYVGGLCSSRYGVGLTESRNRSAWLDSLIVAHEIGHNLGAIHDGAQTCASTPQSYLMAPQLNGSSTFSQCSLDAIFPTLNDAACLVSLNVADPAVAANLGTTHAPAGASFAWSLAVSNLGNSEAANVSVQVHLPAVVSVELGSVANGACTHSEGLSTCVIQNIAVGETRSISFSLRSAATGSFEINASVEAAEDSDLSNNSGSGNLVIAPTADLSVSLDAPSSTSLNSTAEATFAVGNLGASEAAGVSLTLQLPTGFTVQTLQLANGQCTVQNLQATCSLAALAVGASAQGWVVFQAGEEGSKQLQIGASSAYADPVTANNSVSRSIQVTAALTVTANGQSGGGGGGLLASGGSWLLLALSALKRFAAKRRANAHAR